MFLYVHPLNLQRAARTPRPSPGHDQNVYVILALPWSGWPYHSGRYPVVVAKPDDTPYCLSACGIASGRYLSFLHASPGIVL